MLKGFLVLFWPHGQTLGENDLATCPVLAANKQAARDAFLKKQPDASVAAVFSMEDLSTHRRTILELAQNTGADLSVG